MIIVCPRHEGSFDCTPFCDLCEGEQEYNPEQCTQPTPDNIEIYSTHFGGNAVARCKYCQYTNVYWECACELEHPCPWANN